MAKRAMTSRQASQVKISGHLNEQHFAQIIGGRVQAGSHTDKKDVIDKKDRAHSVKAGKWWQIFLYGEKRLRTNTIFQGIGQVANIMLDCLSVYPSDFSLYKKDKDRVKQELRPHMRRLKAELEQENIFKAMLDKSLFDGGNTDFLSLYSGPAKDEIKIKKFHIFHKDDVTSALLIDLKVLNSKRRKQSDTDEQKVVFQSSLHKKQVGEIEDRHDSEVHYKQMKFRLNGPLILAILKDAYQGKVVKDQVIAYGKALKMMQ